MSQEIQLSFDSLQKKFTRSIYINKFELADKKLTISCSFLAKDLNFILRCKRNNIFIGSGNKYYEYSTATITPVNDSIQLLTMVFLNYIDTLDNVDLFSDCETCFNFSGMKLKRSYDVLALDDGSIIKAILIEEGIKVIRYRKFGSVNDSIFSIPSYQLQCIRYRVPQNKVSDHEVKIPGDLPKTKLDIIVLLNKQEINSVVIEVGINEVKYRKFDFPDGPVFSVLKKDIFIIRYENGQTDTLNSNEEYQATQNHPDGGKVTNGDDTIYGGHFSFGGSIGGGGLIGLPIRIYFDKHFVLDLTIGARPMISKSHSSYSVECLNFFYTGGLDLYFTERYNFNKGRLQLHGLFIMYGGSTGLKYVESFYAAGWGYEHYKNDKESFTFSLGVGKIKLLDYDENLLIFWKFGWNFFL